MTGASSVAAGSSESVDDRPMVAVLDYGKLLADGTPDEVRRDKTVIDAYLGAVHD